MICDIVCHLASPRLRAGWVVLLGLSLVSVAQSQTVINWASPSSGNYAVPANWNPQDAPDTPGEVARFAAGGTYTVELPSLTLPTVGAVRVTASDDVTFRPDGVSDAIVNIAGELEVAGGKMEIAQRFDDADLIASMALMNLIDGGQADITDGGQITATQTIIGRGILGRQSRLRVSSSAISNLGNVTVGETGTGPREGTLSVINGATVQTGNLAIASNNISGQEGVVDISDATLTQLGASTLTVGSASEGTANLLVAPDGTLNTGTGLTTIGTTGMLRNDGGIVNFRGDLTLNGGNYLEEDSSGASRTFATGSTIALTDGYMGLDEADFDLTDGLTLAIKSGRAMASGDVLFGPTTTYELNFDASNGSPISASLSAFGNATLGGELVINLANASQAMAGMSLPILDVFGEYLGMFDQVTVPPLPSGLDWFLDLNGTEMRLEIVAANLPGDYNNDNRVDAADYTVWRDSLASGNPIGSYAEWKANFGTVAGTIAGNVAGTASATAVPEPAAIGLMLFGILAAISRKPRI